MSVTPTPSYQFRELFETEGSHLLHVTFRDGDILRFSSKRGVGIGSSKNSITSAYAAEVDPSTNDSLSIVAGIVYGGLMFGLENSRVSSIVLGAVTE